MGTPPEAKAALLSRAWQSALVGEMLTRSIDDVRLIKPAGLPENIGLTDEGYYLSEAQAQAILDMRLQRLTGLEQDKIIAEYKDILAVILDLLDILAKRERINQIIHDELVAIKEQFGDARRSIIDPFGGDIDDEDLIPEREMIITMTHSGYIKTQPTDDYQAQRRGGRGKQAAATKDEDFVETLFVANTHDYLLCFTNLGRCHWIKVYRLPEGGRNSKGRPINNVINLIEDEKVQAILPVREFPDDRYVFFATQNGMVKKVRLSAFKNVRRDGIKAIALKENDSLIGAVETGGSDDIMLFSNLGKALKFNEYHWKQNQLDDDDSADETDDTDSGEENTAKPNGVRPSGRGSGGLRGMRLPENGKIVSLLVAPIDSELQVLTATQNGYGKRTPIADYSRKGKGGQGIIAIDTGDRNGELIGAALVNPTDDLMLITDGGVLIRTKVEQIRETGRAAQGVRLINLDDGQHLVSIEPIAESDDDEIAEDNLPENDTE